MRAREGCFLRRWGCLWRKVLLARGLLRELKCCCARGFYLVLVSLFRVEGLFKCPARGFYGLLFVLTVICMGFKVPSQPLSQPSQPSQPSPASPASPAQPAQPSQPQLSTENYEPSGDHYRLRLLPRATKQGPPDTSISPSSQPQRLRQHPSHAHTASPRPHARHARTNEIEIDFPVYGGTDKPN